MYKSYIYSPSTKPSDQHAFQAKRKGTRNGEKWMTSVEVCQVSSISGGGYARKFVYEKLCIELVIFSLLFVYNRFVIAINFNFGSNTSKVLFHLLFGWIVICPLYL